MNKQAYEHTVGLVLDKRAYWDAIKGATKEWWNGLDDDAKSNIKVVVPSMFLGGILGGTKGLGGALLGAAGGGLLGYYGRKYGKPEWDKWLNYYRHGGVNPSKASNGNNDTEQAEVSTENLTSGQWSLKDAMSKDRPGEKDGEEPGPQGTDPVI